MAEGKFVKVEGTASLRIEKPSGWDWVVFYLWSDEPETESMSVFGQMTPENALAEAGIPWKWAARIMKFWLSSALIRICLWRQISRPV